jgi:hypothetical protein
MSSYASSSSARSFERPIINSVLQAAIVVGLGHVEDFLG